ncbi:MAG TPA: LamG domain-containing protein [Fimbriimonas sp.]|nr:LamG domain-containing protein [Fimbriimonas sp.]
MPLLAALSFAMTLAGSTNATLVASWSGDATYADSVGGLNGRPMGGVTFVSGPPGITKKAFNFDGENSVVFIKDDPRFRFTKGFTISCWVNPLTDARYGSSPQGPLVFRGDDRSGLDPFVLALTSDGHWGFHIEDGNHNGGDLSAPAQINCWTHLCATWDGASGTMCLYVNGQLAATTKTAVHPLEMLDINEHPGVSIGNVQNPFGDHHFQPFNGSIAAVKIYNGAVAKPDYTPLKG